MCGINGQAKGPVNGVEMMNAALSHRGPDFAGVYTDKTVALGHRLLAIRDAASGSRQPFTKPGSPWVLIYNGQIYNTKKMCREHGIPPRDLDTAVMFDLIEKVGWDFVRHIQGMFAIALYNEKEKTLRLYRDGSGQKPVYYSFQNGSLIFASEIKALIANGVKAETSPEGLLVAASLGYIPGTLTLLKGIRKLDAGEMLTYRNGIIEMAYFESDVAGHFDGDPKKVMEELVTEHLASKQKVALNLSGGMDSSVLLHEMKTAGHELITYTTSFADAGESFNDDAEIARKLAKHYGTTHTEIEITKDIYLDNFIDGYAAIEEPNYNISIPTYLEVAKREGVNGDGNRVILSGDGGDEVFGGYPYYGKALEYDALVRRIGNIPFSLAKWGRSGKYFDYGNPVGMWLSFKDFDFTAVRKDRKFLQEYLSGIASRRKFPLADPVRSNMILDRAFWMPGENFIRSDKLYMNETLEMRSPLAYEPFRAYFDQRLQTEDYVADGGNKRFLRNLYRGVLPEYVTEKKKTGWRSPVRLWYQSDPRFKELFLSILSDAPSGGLVDWQKVAHAIQENEQWSKYHFLYLSLAILSKRYGITL